MNTRRSWNRVSVSILLVALLALLTAISVAAQDESLPDPTGEGAPAAAVPAATDNTTPGTAISLACGQSDIPQFLASDSAPRWYKFTANTGWTLVAGVWAAELNWPLDTKLTVLKSNLTTVLTSNDNADGLDPLVHMTIPETGTYYIKLEKVSGQGTATLWLDLPIYVSMAGHGTVDGISYRSHDVLRYRKCSDNWDMHLDMGNLGINGNTAGLAMLSPTTFLVSFSKATTINGQKVTPQDMALLGITDFGWDTAGAVIPRYIKGSTLGLTKASEAIDSIAAISNPNGSFDLLVSIAGNGAVPGLSGIADEDLIRLNLASSTWSMYFDGSDVGLAGVDVWGTWRNPVLNDLFLSFDLPISNNGGANAAQGDIAVCELGTTGQTTTCNAWYNPPGFGFDASAAGLVGKVDAIEITGR